jgi:nucleoside-diphosphate-sugar epimerase
MKVLFIGGTGVISTACTRLALQRGIDLYLLNRGKTQARIPDGANVITADIRDADAAARALEGQTWDCVVNWINFVPEDIERDIALFAGKTGQYIFISSASVYQKPVSHYLVTESTPLANPHWRYSRNKIACEERLAQEYRENGFPYTVVRPSLTYGDTLIPLAVNSWGKPWTAVDRMLRGEKVIVHGDGTSLWVTTHNSDFAKGLVGLLGHAQAVGHAFHITGDEVLTWDQHCRIVGRAVGVEPEIVHIASDLLVRSDPSLEGNLLGDKAHSLVFDNTKLKTFVPDYVATTTFAQGIARTVEWFREDPSRQVVDGEFNAWCDRVIAAHQSALPSE